MTIPPEHSPENPPHRTMTDASVSSAFTSSVVAGMPSAVAACLVAIAVQDRSLAYFQVTPDGCLMSWGGALATYGVESLVVGAPVSEHLFFLEGFFPLMEPHVLLPSVQTPQGLTMDVHLLLSLDTNPTVVAGELQAGQADPVSPGCGWILLLDATAETQRQQQLQQKGNDLSLLRSQYAKLLMRTEQPGLVPVGESNVAVAAPPAAQTLASPPAAQASPLVAEGAEAADVETGLSLRSPQTVSVLVIDLYGLSPSSEIEDGPEEGSPKDAKTVFDLSTAAFSLVMQWVIEEGGIVNHILGTTMVVLFGMMPSFQSSAQQALSAANKLLRHYAQSLGGHRIGMAITTGMAETGLVHIHGSKLISAVGPHIQKAFVLSGRSRPDTLIVDKATLHSWQDDWQDNWDVSQPEARPKVRPESRTETENPLKSARCSRILTTHHDYPDSQPQSLELYELMLAIPLGRQDAATEIASTLSPPPPPSR